MPMIADQLAAQIKSEIAGVSGTDATDALARAIVDYLKANATVVILPINVVVTGGLGAPGAGITVPTTATLT